MDRVPLEADKVENTEHTYDQIGSSTVTETIEETRDFRDLSLMFGFDGEGFEGNMDKALAIYEWAQSHTETSEDALLLVKGAMKMLGTNEKGKTLLKRMFVWTSLEDSIESLRKRQKALSE